VILRAHNVETEGVRKPRERQRLLDVATGRQNADAEAGREAGSRRRGRHGDPPGERSLLVWLIFI